MTGYGKFAAGAMAAAYVPAMTVRGAISGAVAGASTLGKIGAGIGWCVGKPISKVVSLTCKLVNKAYGDESKINAKKHADRTVKIFQTAGALLSIAGLVDLMTAGLSLPVKVISCAPLPVIGAAINTARAVKGKASFKTVYKELTQYGVSPTAKENLFGPFYKNLFSDISHGNAAGQHHTQRLEESADQYDQQRLNLEKKYAAQHFDLDEQKSQLSGSTSVSVSSESVSISSELELLDQVGSGKKSEPQHVAIQMDPEEESTSTEFFSMSVAS